MADMLHRLGYLEQGHLVHAMRNDLVGEYVGQTAPRTKKVMEKAMGGVLFIDILGGDATLTLAEASLTARPRAGFRPRQRVAAGAAPGRVPARPPTPELGQPRKLGCPVKWTESRSEGNMTVHHGRDQGQQLRFAADADGRIRGPGADRPRAGRSGWALSRNDGPRHSAGERGAAGNSLAAARSVRVIEGA